MVDSNSKVVQLSDRKAEGHEAMERQNAHLFARYPAPFRDAIEKGKLSLRPLLQNLFDNVDDALFELADRASHNAEQNMYFESMRELRIKRRGMELNFDREVDENFRRLVQPETIEPEVPTLSDVNTSSLSLVGNDELEELVAIDAMVAKANNKYAKPLADLTARLNHLINSGHVSDKNNPFGPDAVCRAFTGVCTRVDLDIKAKLVIFKLFERHVVAQLDSVLNTCNHLLIEANVLPQGRRRAAAPTPPPRAHAAPAVEDMFADLQNLLHQNSVSYAAASDSGIVAPGRAPAIPRNTLMQLLQAVQKRQVHQLVNLPLDDSFDPTSLSLNIQQSLSDILTAKMPGKALSIGEVDDDAINLVAMLFQFILDDRNLAVQMKALIARLQIPIIKVAMADKSFFSKGGHPARKLLNEIATATLGWTAGANLDRDPLYKEVAKSVNRIVDEYDSNPDLFQDVMTDFIAFLEVDKRRAGLVEQRTIDAEDGKARSEIARNKVDTLLNEKMQGLTLPPVVVTLLRDAWSNVLFLLSLKETEGEEWNRAVTLVDDMIWSVTPASGSDTRQQLLRLLPNMLRELRTGLGQVGYNPHNMNQLFEELEVIHLRQLSGEKSSGEKIAVAPVVAKIPAPPEVIEKDDSDISLPNDADAKLAALDAELAAEFGQDDELFPADDPVHAAPPAPTKTTAPTKTAAPVKPTAAVAKAVEPIKNTAAPAATSVTKTAATAASTAATLESTTANATPAAAPAITARVKAPTAEPAASSVDQQLATRRVEPRSSAAQTPKTASQSYLDKVETLKMGNWMEIHLEDGKKFRCRLAAIIRGTGKYIFVNRSGMKVVEHNRESLALAIQIGTIKLLDEGLLFDRALESVIGNLRNMKSS